MASALGTWSRDERVVVDTGDGAAITFLGDPERALYVALAVLDNVGELPVRMGINLGPVSLMKDINGLDNVVGDGINVAAARHELRRSGDSCWCRSSFYEVMSRSPTTTPRCSRQEGSRNDKHQRAHDSTRSARRCASAAVASRRRRRA